MSLKKPVRKGDELREDILGHAPSGGFALWWLGQSGFLIRSDAGTLLFDPYLSDSLTEKYKNTNKPHVRITEKAIEPDQLDMVEVVTSTHNHTDHLDAATLNPLMEAGAAAGRRPELVIPEANRDFVAERLGCDPQMPVGITDGGAEVGWAPGNAGGADRAGTDGGGAGVGGFRFHGIPAAHNEVERDDQGRCRFLGYVVSFRSGGRSFTVYHSGDTLWHEGLTEALAPFEIDLAMLPINGYKPERGVPGNLWGNEAAELAHRIGAGLVVPCHFDMFEFNTEPPDLFVERSEELGQPYRVLQCGERLHYPS
jgi:L-ascorbate metabolism protein UlaG (beta-lactamase superfamily)